MIYMTSLTTLLAILVVRYESAIACGMKDFPPGLA
jgi:hypothetical protein